MAHKGQSSVLPLLVPRLLKRSSQSGHSFGRPLRDIFDSLQIDLFASRAVILFSSFFISKLIQTCPTIFIHDTHFFASDPLVHLYLFDFPLVIFIFLLFFHSPTPPPLSVSISGESPPRSFPVMGLVLLSEDLDVPRPKLRAISFPRMIIVC